MLMHSGYKFVVDGFSLAFGGLLVCGCVATTHRSALTPQLFIPPQCADYTFALTDTTKREKVTLDVVRQPLSISTMRQEAFEAARYPGARSKSSVLANMGGTEFSRIIPGGWGPATSAFETEVVSATGNLVAASFSMYSDRDNNDEFEDMRRTVALSSSAVPAPDSFLTYRSQQCSFSTPSRLRIESFTCMGNSTGRFVDYSFSVKVGDNPVPCASLAAAPKALVVRSQYRGWSLLDVDLEEDPPLVDPEHSGVPIPRSSIRCAEVSAPRDLVRADYHGAPIGTDVWQAFVTSGTDILLTH